MLTRDHCFGFFFVVSGLTSLAAIALFFATLASYNEDPRIFENTECKIFCTIVHKNCTNGPCNDITLHLSVNVSNKIYSVPLPYYEPNVCDTIVNCSYEKEEIISTLNLGHRVSDAGNLLALILLVAFVLVVIVGMVSCSCAAYYHSNPEGPISPCGSYAQYTQQKD